MQSALARTLSKPFSLCAGSRLASPLTRAHEASQEQQMESNRTAIMGESIKLIPSLIDELRPLREREGILAPLNPTLSLLKRRHDEASIPGKRKDSFKLGLVVEGGGMRGVISGAMLMGLLTLSLRPCFDAVYGASAGAINATFFLSGQPHGLDIYTEDLIDGRFIDLSTLLLPRSLRSYASSTRNATRLNAMDLHHVLSVMRSVRPLDWESVISSNIPLKIVVSSLDAMEPVILDDFTDEKDLADCLAASATVPEVAGPPRLVRGHRCVDAAVFEPVPVASAIKDGCTHIVVLSTRTSSSFGPSSLVGTLTQSLAESFVTRTLLDGKDSYMREAWAKAKSFRAIDQETHDALRSSDPDVAFRKLGAHVLPIHPRTTSGVHPLCTDRSRLEQARAEGFLAVEEQVGVKLGLGMRPEIDIDAWYHWQQHQASDLYSYSNSLGSDCL